MRRQSIIVKNIHIRDRWRRHVDEKVVDGLVASISALGLRSPISVVFRDGVEIDGEAEDGVPVLVAGRHRLEAIRRLGWEVVECDLFDDPISAEKWEISENLHRAELTALERDEQVARWIELTGSKSPSAEVLSRQPDAKPKGGRPEGGTRAAARELGLSEADARRAIKVASLSDAAKETARQAGLDDNRTALQAAAREPTPDRQAAKIKEWDAAREVAAAKSSLARKERKATIALDEENALADFYAAWADLPEHRRVEALREIGAVLVTAPPIGAEPEARLQA